MNDTVKIERRRLEVLEKNSRDLSSVVTATHPLFASTWDVVGDGDLAMVTMKYEDWEHLLFVMKPFHPKEIEKLERVLFPKQVAKP